MIERTITWNYISNRTVSVVKVYRSEINGFTPSSSTLIATLSPTATEYVDTVSDGSATYYYMVELERDGEPLSSGSFISEPKPPEVISIDRPAIQSHNFSNSILQLTSTDFSSTTDEHVSTDWILFERSGDAGLYSIEDTVNLTAIDLELLKTGSYEIKVKYNGNKVESPWSNWYVLDYTFEGVPPITLGGLNAIDVDNNGIIYAAGRSNIVFKLSATGNVLWEYSGHTGTINSVAVDGIGNVYSVSSDNQLHKIDPTGEKIWSMNPSNNTLNGVQVDIDGFSYCCGTDNNVTKIDTDGSPVWVFTNHTSTVWDVALDNSGNVYSCSSDGTVRKIDTNGVQVWSYTITDTDGNSVQVYDIDVDSIGNVYAVSQEIVSSVNYATKLTKVNASGTFVWEHVESNELFGSGMDLTLDNDGHVYSSTWEQSTHAIKKFNANDGTEITTWKFTRHDDTVTEVKYSNGYVYSCDLDGIIRKIDAATNIQVLRIP